MNDYSNEILKASRENIGSKFYKMIANATRRTRYVDYEDDYDNLMSVQETLDDLMALFNSYNPEEKQARFGGEFATLYQGNYPMTNGEDIPLYLFLDLLDAVLFNTYKDSKKHGELYETVRGKAAGFRDQLARLQFDEKFDPQKHLNKYILSDFNGKAQYSFQVENKQGLNVLVLHTERVYDNVTYRNGDYYSDGDPTYSSGADILYQEDYDRVRQIEITDKTNRAKARMARFEKYFIDGEIPEFRDVRSALLNPELDERLIEVLENFCIAYHSRGIRSYGEFALSENCTFKLEQLDRVEKELEIESEKAIERATTIVQAKQRYKSKSLFWKMMHRKMALKRMDFDGMSTEEIGKLYTR